MIPLDRRQTHATLAALPLLARPALAEDKEMETGTPIRFGGDTVTFLAVTGQTGGAYAIAHVASPPEGGPPPLHRHAFQETFVALEGTVTLFRGQADGGVERLELTAGQAAHVAPMQPHTFRNFSGAPARFLAVLSPGGPFEAFAAAVAELGRNGPPAMPEVIAAAARNGIEIMGPPPG